MAIHMDWGKIPSNPMVGIASNFEDDAMIWLLSICVDGVGLVPWRLGVRPVVPSYQAS